MGYRIPTRTAVIVFDEDHRYHGAEVTLRLEAPMGLLFRFQQIGQTGVNTSEIIQEFARELLVEWNLEDAAGEMIPATEEGILHAPLQFAVELVQHWVKAATEPEVPLSGESSDGSSLVAPSGKTASRSASRSPSRRRK